VYRDIFFLLKFQAGTERSGLFFPTAERDGTAEKNWSQNQPQYKK
jgi:hypothetical protein